MEAKHSQSGEKVAVHLNYKKQLEMLDRDMIQQLNIIFKRIFNVLKFKMVRVTFLCVTFVISKFFFFFCSSRFQHNRNFYDPASATSIRQYNLSIWPGYVTAVDKYEGGLLLQCDLSHRVLRTETVRDILVKLGKQGGSVKTEAEKALLGISVLTR